MSTNGRSTSLWRRGHVALILLIGAILLGFTASSTRAANPAPAQIYFLSLPADDTLDVLEAVYSGAASPVTSYT